jgi:hypothetical protein
MIAINKRFKRTTILCCFLFGIVSLSFSQTNKITLSGYVKDAVNGEAVIGATIYIKELKLSTSSNEYGFFSISIPKGKYALNVNFLGYKNQEFEFELLESKYIDFHLHPIENLIDEVNVLANKKNQNTKSNEISINKLEMKSIVKIPALMGEVDILRSIQLLPGVHSSGEGSIGFFVRGGGIDQNLILLDEATVYNASHLGGVFSVFNQDAIKEVTLYKGGIPALYGGRLSSILDIRMKEGNSKQLGLSGGIGMVSSRLTIEAPIIKDKLSFIISGRRTYFDQFFPLFKDSILKGSKAYFYDLNAKLNFQINENNRVFISCYLGQDVFQIGNSVRVNYGNKTLTTRYNHLFSKKLFSNICLIYSIFDYGMGIPEGTQGFDWQSGINDILIKNDYTLFFNPKNTIRFGGNIIHHSFRPGKIAPIGEQSIFIYKALPNIFALESGIFVENDQILTAKISARYGLRFSMFQNLGPYTSYIYEKSTASTYSVVDSLIYSKNELFNNQLGMEPRISLKMELNQNSSIKLSYNHTIQYLHLTTNTMSTTPLDLWFPSTPNIHPQIADQFSIGYFKNFKSDKFETSIETYYKDMKNCIDFADHAQLLLNRYMEGELRFGKSYSYGIEIFIKKQSGKFTGWFSYSYSRVFRKIPEINLGMKYPAHYDKPNDISIVLSYDITKKLNASLNWVYATGAPRTMPTGRFEYGGMIVPVYSARNDVRLPDYHRMDVAITYNFIKKRDMGKPKKFTNSLNFSIYNLYNRHNPYSVTFNQSQDDPYRTEATKFFLFKAIPTLTYNFKFN